MARHRCLLSAALFAAGLSCLSVFAGRAVASGEVRAVELSAEDRRLLAEYGQCETAQAPRGARDGGDAQRRGDADDKAGTTSATPTSLPRTSERKEQA